ncbi:MAG: extracellular catalytic domain type 1 short-chain-length polyhydroxyalkanoate depolymerase [Planctomycetaceae bacterium]
MAILLVLSALLTQCQPLGPGDHTVQLSVDERPRSYRVHVPPQYDARRPLPVVLVYHGSTMNARMMAGLTGLNDKADEAEFIAVYLNGTGAHKQFLTFNGGEDLAPAPPGGRPDDVKFTAQLLDDLAMRANVDAKRVYATGISCGGMMCYRLAVELPGRIAAIASVAGPMPVELSNPGRPMPVLHFHGTADQVVPFGGPDETIPETVQFRSVAETMRLWARTNGCASEPESTDLPDLARDGTTVRRLTWGAGRENAQVVLYAIEGGGHTWPGTDSLLNRVLGRTTRDISANDILWEFFSQYALP